MSTDIRNFDDTVDGRIDEEISEHMWVENNHVDEDEDEDQEEEDEGSNIFINEALEEASGLNWRYDCHRFALINRFEYGDQLLIDKNVAAMRLRQQERRDRLQRFLLTYYSTQFGDSETNEIIYG